MRATVHLMLRKSNGLHGFLLDTHMYNIPLLPLTSLTCAFCTSYLFLAYVFSSYNHPPSPYHIPLLERHTSFFCADTIFPRSHSLPSSFFENDFKLLNSILSHITMHCVTAINSFMCVRQCCPHCCLLALSTHPIVEV